MYGPGVCASRAYHYGDAMMYQQRKLKRAGRFALINNPPQRTVIVCHGMATSKCGIISYITQIPTTIRTIVERAQRDLSPTLKDHR